MGMSATPVRWTASQLAALPDDGKRYEIIDGQLFVTPAPALRHQRALRLLVESMNAYVESCGLEMFFAPVDVAFSDTTVVEPDVIVVPRRADGRRLKSSAEIRQLMLAVEVLSPGTARRDRGVKRRLYQREGVEEYWVIDLDARVVERWRPTDVTSERIEETMEWRPVDGVAPHRIHCAEFFAEVDER
jgi:Uma2 family endonuclease